MSWYPLVKWLHIVSSTVLFGTGAGIVFFFLRAQRTGDTKIIAAVGRDVVANGSPLPAANQRYYRWWFALGWPAFTGVLVIFYLVAAKP